MKDDAEYYSELLENSAVHPGVFIKDELDARGWSASYLASQSGYSEKFLNRILTCRTKLSVAQAKGISKAFGVSNDLLIELTKDYNSIISKQDKSVAEQYKNLQSTYPMREMIRRGWLRETQQDFMTMQMVRFFEVSCANELIQASSPFAAKKTDYTATSPVQLAWLFRVRQIARLVDAPLYSEDKLRETLPRLRNLMNRVDDIRYVPELLRQCGVRLVAVETLKGAKICGATCWLSDREPVIGMSTRYNRIDNFWFVLRHEIEHVLCQHGKQSPLLDGDRELSLAGDVEEHERIANKASLEFGISSKDFERFIVTKGGAVTASEISSFAQEQHVHPGIIAGLVRRHSNDWSIFNRLNAKIRSVLIKNILYDGWGYVAPVEL